MGRGLFYSLALLHFIKSSVSTLDCVCRCWEQCSVHTGFSRCSHYIAQVLYSVWGWFLFLGEVCLDSWLWSCLLLVFALSIFVSLLAWDTVSLCKQYSLQWWQMSTIPAVERGRQEDGSSERPFLTEPGLWGSQGWSLVLWVSGR